MQYKYLYFFILFLMLCSPGTPVDARHEAPSWTGDLTLPSMMLPTTQPPLVGMPTVQSAVVISPLPGQALQGNVPIVVHTAIEGFTSVELSFSYFDDPTDTWFLIYQSDRPVMEAILAQWDTSTITDGVYNLRMIVYLNDGKRQTVTVPGIRVRNYTPIETDTPTPVPPTETLSPVNLVSTEVFTPTETLILPTPTPLPLNPAELNRKDVLTSVLKGALAVAGLFALGILYWSLRSHSRNRLT